MGSRGERDARTVSVICSVMMIISGDHLVRPESGQESDMSFLCGQMQTKTFSEKYSKWEAQALLRRKVRTTFHVWVCKSQLVNGKASF